jgi:tyrosinase
LAEARGLTAAKPELDRDTTLAVSRDSVIAALRPTDFVGFGSAKAPNHSAARGSGPLESGPHNLVHNNIAGFMGDFMSPTDPIFFLHHANIDRLWDVWTRKQQLRGLPILPDGYLVQPPVAGTDYFRWANEPFLFFTDYKKQPVTKTKAGDYATIGDFSYDYQPGTGETVVPIQEAAARTAARPVQRFSGQIQTSVVRPVAAAKVTLPPALLRAAGPNAPALFAKITVDMASLDHGSRLGVFIDGPADLTGAGPSSANYAGTLAMFGHHLIPAPFTFTVPLSAPIAGLRARRALAADSSVNIRVVEQAGAAPHSGMAAHGASAKAEVLSVVVEATSSM